MEFQTQQQHQQHGSSTLTQEDLDRVWKPIFEDYHGDGCCEGCTTRPLGLPLSILKDLLGNLPREQDFDEAVEQRRSISRRNQNRIDRLRGDEATLPIPRWVLELVTKQADADADGWIEYKEFCAVVLENKDRLTSTHLSGLEMFVQQSVRSVTPKYYDEYYGRCCPPPLFIPLISLVEIAVFIWYCVEMKSCTASGPVPIYSPLVYDPKRRREAWRYVSYMLVHAGIVHIAMNILIQLLLGIPLEMVHKGWRILLVYVLGALMGGLAHSVTDFNTFLVGASGGVYALIGAHVANVVMNWKEMRFGIVRTLILAILICADVGMALYKRYGTSEGDRDRVGYAAHLGGFLGGLFLGIVCLKNLRVHSWERVLWYLALVVVLLLMLVGVLVNTFYDGYPEENALSLHDYYDKMFKQWGPKN